MVDCQGPTIWTLLAGVLCVPAQVASRGIVHPNPVSIGQPMTVTCSAETIGGVGKLTDLDAQNGVFNIRIYHENLSEPHLLYFKDDPQTTDMKIEVGGVTATYSTTGGNRAFNAETMQMTLKFEKAACDALGTYKCEVEWKRKQPGPEKIILNDTAEPINIPLNPPVTMIASPELAKYKIGQTINFTCLVPRGPQGINMQWKQSLCTTNDDFQPASDNGEMTQTRLDGNHCDNGDWTYSTRLTFATSTTVCWVGCQTNNANQRGTLVKVNVDVRSDHSGDNDDEDEDEDDDENDDEDDDDDMFHGDDGWIYVLVVAIGGFTFTAGTAAALMCILCPGVLRKKPNTKPKTETTTSESSSSSDSSSSSSSSSDTSLQLVVHSQEIPPTSRTAALKQNRQKGPTNSQRKPQSSSGTTTTTTTATTSPHTTTTGRTSRSSSLKFQTIKVRRH